MAEQGHDPAVFHSVDGTQDPGVYVGFMDWLREVDTIRQQKELTFSLMRVSEGHSVLDVGCGTGDDVMALARLAGSGGRAVGVDVSETMIAEACKRAAASGLPVEFHRGEAYSLPFADESFDATRSERLFEHLEEPQRALREMVRVTRHGGWVVVCSPDVDSHMFDLPDRDLVRKLAHAECDRRPNGWAGRRLHGDFREAGLIDLQVSGVVHRAVRVVESLEFDKRGQRALDAGRVTPDEAERWLRLLEEAKSTGRFFYATVHFVVAGRRP